jgi:hypothetical protein
MGQSRHTAADITFELKAVVTKALLIGVIQLQLQLQYAKGINTFKPPVRVVPLRQQETWAGPWRALFRQPGA